MRSIRSYVGVLSALLAAGAWACRPSADDGRALFQNVSPDRTEIAFANTLRPTEDLNTYVFRNFYNGGGVAIGDLNNDGKPDVFFTGNQVSNKLYLNKGNFRFEDITERAGVSSEGIWSTGVSMADVNGDGWLDIYVCKSGPPGGDRRHNELFVNNGDGTFTEKAREYGLAVTGLSIHASFFDYDGDGDLDMYLLSNPVRSLDQLQPRSGLRDIPDQQGGNRLYRNESTAAAPLYANRIDRLDSLLTAPRFVDATTEAGIYSSKIGFGLGVSVSDVNRDGWPDIYVSNDFFERDYLYVNNQDGSFEEVLPQVMTEISLSSMGGDIADLTQDGYPEVFVSDMLPAGHDRLMSKISFETWEEWSQSADEGYHHQFTRNTLQLNRGPAPVNDARTGKAPYVYFSEVGRLAGVEASDWSWGGLIADFDLDGYRDLFVPNGIYKDLLDQDFITTVSNPAALRSILTTGEEPILTMLERVPSTPIPNHMFAGRPELRFTDVTAAWGLSEPTFSNGSAYGDLDGDGDLDLVISNVNMGAIVYRNRASELYPDRAWLQVDLFGRPPNTYAVGAQVAAWSSGRQWYLEQQPVRGFQSTVDHTLHFGLGPSLPAQRIDSLVLRWPDGDLRTLRDVGVNRRLTIRHQDAAAVPDRSVPSS